MTEKTETPAPGAAPGSPRVDRRAFLRGAGLAAAAEPA